MLLSRSGAECDPRETRRFRRAAWRDALGEDLAKFAGVNLRAFALAEIRVRSGEIRWLISHGGWRLRSKLDGPRVIA